MLAVLSCYTLPNGNVGCIIQVSSGVAIDGRLCALEYDPMTDQLALTPAIFASGRDEYSCAMQANGRALCNGGHASNSATYVLDDIFEYDPVADTFTTRPVVTPRPLGHHATAVGPDGRAYFLGGYVSTTRMTDIVFAYSPACP